MRDPFFAAQMKATAEAWRAPYIGDHHHAFLATIQEMKRDAQGADYKNIIPIIQSSGAGKSRLVHEVANLVFTLPLNLRPPKEDSAYPPTDVAPRRYLVPFGPYYSAPPKMRLLQLSFLATMLDVAAEYVRDLSPGKIYEDEAELAADWREFLDRDEARSRHEFYDRVVKETNKRTPPDTWNAEPGETDGFLYKLSDETSKKGIKILTDAIASRLRGEPKNTDIRIFVYIDEVYNLSTISCKGDPSTTLYDTLLDAFNDVGPANPIFFATIATSPSILRPVDRLLRHQPPWTSFVWDYLPDRRPIFRRGEMTLQEVAEPSFMAKFGRPLFWTRWNAADEMNLQNVKKTISDFAFVKLTLCRDVSEFDEAYRRWGRLHPASRIAPICTRVSVDFLSGTHAAREVEERMVAANMRSLASVPVENDSIESSTPSEPLLADAAAQVMSESTYSPVGELARCAERGWLKHGPDLATRLLLLSAYDRAVRKTFSGLRYDERRYSAALPLLDFLQELFDDRWHDVLRGSRPAGAALSLEEAFAGAFVRFSHFIVFDGTQALDVRTALAGVARGFACRVEPPQPGVDIAIPVVMRDAKLDLDVMSFLLIQVVRGTAPRRPSAAALAELFPPSATETHPVIHLAMQLEPGTRESAPEPVDETPATHPCYCLTAYGCSPSVYKAVDDANAAAYATVARPYTLAGEHIRQNAEHMQIVASLKNEWERGPGCYGWTGDAELNRMPDKGGEERVEGLFAL
ncbi:hypothetical protein PsYK624_102980 [Phanerochaete sordida]|uniref:Uncharacterized protein n=1 Tax=Phanerochaete sordida TaxID=48140 RepID=A0A9P3GFV0_9APHY|nr:hypothetical protein PsYK624_102980 [Phanerochaete sordida]